MNCPCSGLARDSFGSPSENGRVFRSASENMRTTPERFMTKRVLPDPVKIRIHRLRCTVLPAQTVNNMKKQAKNSLPVPAAIHLSQY